MNKELTKEEAEEFYNKLWLENKELIQDNMNKLSMERFELELELVDKNKEIERLNKERNKTYENGLNYFLELQEKKEEIERLNNIINKTSKRLEMTLNCIKDYMVEDEEYIKIHTDYIYALEEQIKKLKGVDKE